MPVALLYLAVVAGCGGGGPNPQTEVTHNSEGELTTRATAISKGKFVKEADAICEAARERASEEFQKYLKKNVVPSSGPGMLAKAHDVVNTVFVPVVELQVKKISDLGAPRKDVVQVNEILAAMQQGIERAKEQPLQFIRKETAMNQASKLAEAYGLDACGNGRNT